MTPPEEKKSERQKGAGNYHIKPGALFVGGRCRHCVCRFGAFDSLWRQLEGPGQTEGNGQTDYDQHDKQTNDPVRNGENGQYLREALSKRPPRDDIGDGNLVNVPPLEFGEERTLFAHDAAGRPSFASKFLWRGSSRRPAHNGAIT